jgi:hypothetical protein
VHFSEPAIRILFLNGSGRVGFGTFGRLLRLREREGSGEKNRGKETRERMHGRRNLAGFGSIVEFLSGTSQTTRASGDEMNS